MRRVIDHADGVRAERESGVRRETRRSERQGNTKRCPNAQTERAVFVRFWLAHPPAPPRHCRSADLADGHYERPERPGSRLAADSSDCAGASARNLIPDQRPMENPSSNARPHEEKRSDQDTPDLLRCSFCGGSVRNTAEENAALECTPYPFDEGVGVCRRCGGDPNAETDEERLGHALTAFVRARVPVIAARLGSANRVKFLAMPIAKQAHVVYGLLKAGAIRW